ncbi:MAG: hypothetical protein RBR42_05695 [Desulfomicrobium sp.]|jgi:hypothetical protein|nr:hypothetical protein [Desulfomicrobium sp.]
MLKKLQIVLYLLVVLVAGCASLDRDRQLVTEDGLVHLWGRETFPVDPEWEYLQTIKFDVQGQAWNALVQPQDKMQTMIFVRQDQEPPALLLLSRVNKLNRQVIYRPLGGHKTEINGRPFREQTFGLDADTDDLEYSKYVALVRDLGVALAPIYSVRVLDRLPLDTVLIRAMELYPGQATIKLPSYGKLYPQEIQDQFFMRDARP